ncbi:asparagine synthase-related protein [Sphingobium sp. AP50]|uniref:asparagine synthase-related protein n=1 Tax=Sphingobium sp. AP50 TaxID=1884369 RepID=UPI0015A53848|nr:asparagine synthetase B family protein [Sphingobium sp. AP50]
MLGSLYGRHATKADLGYGLETQPTDWLQYLRRNCWGSYVALVDGPPLIARDPSGAVPTYYRHEDGIILCSNDVALFGGTYAIDWAMLRLNMTAEGYHGDRTCLADIFELRPATLLDGSCDPPSTQSFWSPWTFASLDRHDHAPNADELEAVIDHAVTCLASPFERPLALMSGGLDSSIVLAGLSKAGKAAQCLTMATKDPSGDERIYARMVAEHFGFPLHEGFYDTAHVDPARCAAPHLPHPKRRPLYQSMAHLATDVADATGADAFFSGNGGDHVFCFLQSATPILDCLRAGRPLLEVLAAYENIALLTGCSLGEALGSLWRRSRRPVRYSWPLTDDLLYAEQITQDATHPWLDCPEDALPGKAFHIAMLARMQEDMEAPFPLDGPPMVTPLMAQPVMETCLTIPSWKWISGGRNRSIARDAFRRRLPQKIADRRGKPGPARFSFEILKSFESRLKQMLLDGILAEQGIIDRGKVEAACGAIATLDGTQGRRLLQLADAESWCRHWSGRKIAYSPSDRPKENG